MHSWLDGKKLKSLALEYERIRNVHRLSMKLEPKEKQELAIKMKELADLKYWRS